PSWPLTLSSTSTSGTVVETGTPADTQSGVFGPARISYSGPASGTVCDLTVSSCTIDASAWPDGTYTLTGLVQDRVGNTTTPTQTLLVDHTGPATTWSAPGANAVLSGTQTVAIVPNDGTGVGFGTVDIDAVD